MNIQTSLKIDINIAITISVTILLLWNTQVAVHEVKENTDTKINKTLDALDRLSNNTQLSDKQIIQIIKEIRKEVK